VGPIYLDANALIEAVEKEGSNLLRSLATFRSDGITLLTSELSLAEVLVVPMRMGDDDLMGIHESLLGENGLVATIPVDRAVLRESAFVRAKTGQKLPDAIHIATAALSDCEIFVSSDKRLRLPNPIRQVAADEVKSIGTTS
jgi:predicted nucleic acid-binding protein